MKKHLLLLAIVAIAACAPTAATHGRSTTPELARPGSIARGTGAIVPLSLCQRGMRVVAATRLAPALARLGYVCGAARGL